MIGLLGVKYDYCVSPAHSEIVLIYKELKANSEIMAFWKLRGGLWHNVIVAKTDTNSDLFTELYSSVDKVTKEFLPKLAT